MENDCNYYKDEKYIGILNRTLHIFINNSSIYKVSSINFHGIQLMEVES